MKRLLVFFLMLILLSGCTEDISGLDRAMSLRETILNSNGCSFDAVITADYGDKIYTFSMNCRTDSIGNLKFTVTDPSSISGISGTVSEAGGNLTFDDQVLAFSLLADDQVTPVSAPWIFIHTLRGGYLSSCGIDGEGIKITIDDSYADDALRMDIWTDGNDLPIRGEILWDGRRIVSIEVRNFEIL